MSDDDKVARLPVRFKQPPSEDHSDRTLLLAWERPKAGACDHRWRVQYLIREGEAEVECGGCGTRLDPMWVLKLLATEDRRYSEARKTYLDEQKRLAERKRTKCESCGHMTRISSR